MKKLFIDTTHEWKSNGVVLNKIQYVCKKCDRIMIYDFDKGFQKCIEDQEIPVCKSDIIGNGYGDKHIWRNQGSRQGNLKKEEKCTLYVCVVCGSFFHYHDLSDIFKAMKESKVSEICI